MASDYAKMATEMQNRGWVDLDDPTVRDNFNTTKVGTKTVPVTSAELLAWAGRREVSGAVKAAAEDSTHAVHDVALVADVMLRRDGTDLDLARTDRQQMLQALVDGGVISADDKADLEAVATVDKYLSETVGGTVTLEDVRAARRRLA